MTLTIDRLNSILACDPMLGVFYWKVPAKRRKIDDVAGTLRKDGYIQIQIDYELHLVHRLMIFVQCGEYPEHEVDHINRNRSDNRLVNLRCADRKQNSENKSMLSNNTSGYRGVCWDPVREKWKVQIKHNKVNKFVGRYDSIEDANVAAINARNLIFTHNVESK